MSEFVESLHETFERLGRIETRRMFGGHGIWHEGRMIALVAKDTLYLKADAESAAHFDKLNLPPFTYVRQGKSMPMSYRQAPADLFEDREEAALWGRLAYEAALRSGQPPKPKKTPAKKTAVKKAAVKKTSVKKKTAKAASR
ncbi:DNA transformation protein [Variovorax sp. YR634]|jgi:DNA transformation protein|uniref:TfoX/Sxy family protein n=1 Tax=unclassified Variovorax TaxID=663243 RepID=UPI00089B3AF7|nr:MULTISPECIES: TfoX/Sxy family protein [unclassified Variovorax]SDW82642.1 DNA transformation protein [Variovorax sp. YR634]SOD26597.1 DNA transformation protein [Variovorax sp. YR752]